LQALDGMVRPGQPGEEEALLTFLRREFPGRWRYDCEEALRNGQRFSDYMLLWTERGVDACCVLTFADSMRPIERFYPYQLPRPWGQLGTVGVSVDRRGRGYGLAVVDAGLRRLHNNGINGCVIDWTGIVGFYAKFGFTPYREYQQMEKEI
jgi:predicted N-acetyltransferase YhbS